MKMNRLRWCDHERHWQSDAQVKRLEECGNWWNCDRWWRPKRTWMRMIWVLLEIKENMVLDWTELRLEITHLFFSFNDFTLFLVLCKVFSVKNIYLISFLRFSRTFALVFLQIFSLYISSLLSFLKLSKFIFIFIFWFPLYMSSFSCSLCFLSSYFPHFSIITFLCTLLT